ncbi:hypothetical protein BDF14DRAFT_1861574 [Spinellus fusiger]|nr:hypothetical protein BDF14DRAFT_1861574 [Spinellus fusiger]
MNLVLQAAQFPTNKQKICYLCLYLQGPAFTWCQPYLESLVLGDNERQQITFVEFLQLLRDNFGKADKVSVVIMKTMLAVTD